RMLGLVRLKDELDEETSEFAILVRSRLKGHGLGWLLMQWVIDYAKQKGLRRVYGDVLAENKAMLQMCAELGFDEEDIGSGLRRVVLDLENTADAHRAAASCLSETMSAIGTKRTSACALHMSAFDPKRTFGTGCESWRHCVRSTQSPLAQRMVYAVAVV
ncbi:MAG: GNAT family N-acetyltransferase, partial [Pseudolabrys sp.]